MICSFPCPPIWGNISLVHPHVRGEHHDWGSVPWCLLGSSPRAWGTLSPTVVANVVMRFIPTCVGNTRPRRTAPSHDPVHPHVRGEHRRDKFCHCVNPGSSPRAWGTRALPVGGGGPMRFIPTCVGNTVKYVNANQHKSVHPHVRGEHRPNDAALGPGPGSSPRAWGTPRPPV